MSEMISLPVLQSAVDNLRRRAADMSSLERCKLHCLEENLRIVRDQQMCERADLLFARYCLAARTMQANADAAGEIADAIWVSNCIVSRNSRDAIQRSRRLIDVCHA